MKIKWTKIIFGLLIAVPAAYFITGLIVAAMAFSGSSELGKIYREKVEIFSNLPTSEHERLIEISKEFHAEQYEADKYILYSTNTVLASSGHEKMLPQEFIDFGFYKAKLGESKFIGRMYWLVDSGGEAEVDWSNTSQPTITFFQGTGRDLITKVYPKEIEAEPVE